MPRCRPFRLIDLMIAVASAAFLAAEMRPLWHRFQMARLASPNGVLWPVYAGTIQAGLTVTVLSLAVTYVWIRLIPPRLRLPDMIRQPGMIFLELLIGLSFPLLALSAFVPLVPPTTLIFAVVLALSWFVVGCRYRSRAEPGWIEGLGRCFGVALLVAIAAS